MSKKIMVCPNCYYVGKPKFLAKGSLLVFIILLPIFPLALLYAIICSAGPQNVCPNCQTTLIPSSSARGAEILSKDNVFIPEEKKGLGDVLMWILKAFGIFIVVFMIFMFIFAFFTY